MMPHTALSADLTLDYLGVAADDRDGCLQLLAGTISPAAAKVQEYLLERLGSADETVPDLSTAELPVTEADWLEAMLRFVPSIIDWHSQHDISEAVSRDSLADFGRNLAINRRVHGGFGMDTYKWLTHTFAGRLFQLGRLQYLIHQSQDPIPGLADGEWILGIHIPEGGGLGTTAVAESLALAAPFFERHFPDRPVRFANCASWLLDPYLAERIDQWSNIARFANLFTPYQKPQPQPTDAVYFTFRTRSMENLAALPRETALQRIVLERIDAGGVWQLGFGYLSLPS